MSPFLKLVKRDAVAVSSAVPGGNAQPVTNAADPVIAAAPSTFRLLMRDPAGAISLTVVILIFVVAVFAPWIAPQGHWSGDMANALKPPGEAGWLGTDSQGRDMVSRLIFGLQTTMLMAVTAVIVGCSTGAVIGLSAAYYPPVSGLLMRLMDILLSFPTILFGLAIAAILGPGLWAVVVALSISSVPLMARVVRGAALTVMQQEYIESARALGVSDLHLWRRHLLPNCMSSIMVFVTLRFGQVILLGAALSFIGLGAQPPSAELGSMASEGRTFLFFAPHVSVLPSLLIFIVVLAFNTLGDALRDVLDPKLRS